MISEKAMLASRDPPSPPWRGERQALAAMFDRAGKRAPAAFDIGAIGFLEARRHGDAVGRPFRADLSPTRFSGANSPAANAPAPSTIASTRSGVASAKALWPASSSIPDDVAQDERCSAMGGV
jgi:hypothetical protein